jgi:hypothetical protein
VGERGLAWQSLGVVADSNQQRGSGVGADPWQRQQRRRGPGNQPVKRQPAQLLTKRIGGQ